MKLLFQSDDYGFTESVSCGILKAIDQGIVRNTGLFVNMPASEYSAELIKDYEGICVGQDINLVAGKPVSEIELVPSLVDERGMFISSVDRIKCNKIIKKEGNTIHFERDPYVYEEVYVEIENQINKFIDLMGRKPGYLHGHSLSTPNIKKAMEELSHKYELKLSHKIANEKGLAKVPVDWNPKPFSFEEQMKTDVEEELLKSLGAMLNEEKVLFISHCGFVEADLFPYTTYTAIRMKDLKAATSTRLKEFLEENNIELITYDDLE